MSQRKQFKFLDRLRVRWAEVDMQKIVFNGHYLMYIDTAVAGYWRALALPYHETMEHLGGDLYVRKATLEYFGSARYDDQLEVGIRTARIGNSSMLIEGAVFRGEELLVSGELVYVFANPATQTSLPVPAALREVLTDFEAGDPMVSVSTGTWEALGAAAGPIRQQVFVQEQKIPADLEWDEADLTALHALAVNRFGVALATGRLVTLAPGVAKIGRMAVMASMRGSRIGRAVLDALVHAAAARGDHEVLLHAQATAAPFYLRAGFSVRGEPFEEAGIEHIEMTRLLRPPAS
ncbi:YbgC/FadM family acyl-CoA thioesterase [Ideonella sp. A 288]|uniref:YbgC/FadM family acyl-CoA thioesterase n=1 Tax=Ideonella sp. A 288 TaxID=1962181 RepID=UPI000B4BDC41|nr:YbgC/FadM family acyl-CoA thioesterase [Ideonella sp. A 288]